MWIKRHGAQVQQKGLWDSRRAINRAHPCARRQGPDWENPARITQAVPIQIRLIFVNDLLSLKISERIVARLPDPLMNP